MFHSVAFYHTYLLLELFLPVLLGHQVSNGTSIRQDGSSGKQWHKHQTTRVITEAMTQAPDKKGHHGSNDTSIRQQGSSGKQWHKHQTTRVIREARDKHLTGWIIREAMTQASDRIDHQEELQGRDFIFQNSKIPKWYQPMAHTGTFGLFNQNACERSLPQEPPKIFVHVQN